MGRLEEVNKTLRALGLPEITELKFIDKSGKYIEHKGGRKRVRTRSPRKTR